VNPSDIIQRQLDCYNARDLAGLLATYSPDAVHRDLQGNILAVGHEQLRERFAVRFAEPDLHAKLLQRTVMGTIVVDHEIITRNFAEPEGVRLGTIEMLCIYEVVGNTIARATFALGKKTLLS
jgi:hypothetical protein